MSISLKLHDSVASDSNVLKENITEDDEDDDPYKSILGFLVENTQLTSAEKI